MSATTETAPPSRSRPLRVRRMDFPFADAAIPRWWLYGNPILTNVANGLNLLFPPGERFFIRSVKHYLDQIDDPELKARVKAFFGQEGRHGHEHERMNRVMARHGYDIERILRLYERVAFEMVEPRVPPVLRLSTTVALEHFTASLAEGALTRGFLDGAHPVMRDLLRWHAAEEIEHKSVAFDVLKKVDPRYSVRIAGLVIATTQLFAWWIVATAMLMAQDDLSPEERARYSDEAEQLREAHGAMTRSELVRRAIFDYLRPDFHPDDHDDYALAREYLASVGAQI